MEERTDITLVALARAGDKAAFGQLIERYQPMVKRIALGMLSNPDIAGELAQDAILQAYLSLEHLQDDARFKNWLYGITLNVCRSYIRAQKADICSLEALMGGVYYAPTMIDFAESMLDPQVIVEEQELHQGVLQAIDNLSAGDRMATLLFYYEQLSLGEIARLLEVSVVAIKGRLHRARKQLRALLAPLNVDQRSVTTGPFVENVETIRQDRRKVMIKARINSVRRIPVSQQHIVILQDEASSHVLNIWIAQPDATGLIQGLAGTSSPRPLTIQFIANLLKTTGMQVEEVRIEDLKNEVFYAVVKVRNGNEVHEIDARPSDALSLAVQTGSPIYIAEEVLERYGTLVPEGVSLEAFIEDQEHNQAQIHQQLASIYTSRWPAHSPEEILLKMNEFITTAAKKRPLHKLTPAEREELNESFRAWLEEGSKETSS